MSRFRSTRASRLGLLTAGVLTAGLALAAAGPAAAAVTPAAPSPATAPIPKGSEFPLGAGYMGVGYLKDAKDFKADTRQLALSPATKIKITPSFYSGGPAGIDVSHYQGTINWASVRAAGIQFAYIKATEGTTYTDPTFSTNYLHAYNNGVIRGAYHFAQPGSSSGATQAAFFATHGGAWSADNLTLPGMLDLEGGCYGLSAGSMQSWILDFYNTYKSRTTRDVVIYTSPSWWNTCTGGWSGMYSRSPLFVANWTTASSPTIPNGFPYATIWQYTDTGTVSGISGYVDRDRFNGDRTRLLALANNT